jgi:hypothetical protein
MCRQDCRTLMDLLVPWRRKIYWSQLTDYQLLKDSPWDWLLSHPIYEIFWYVMLHSLAAVAYRINLSHCVNVPYLYNRATYDQTLKLAVVYTPNFTPKWREFWKIPCCMRALRFRFWIIWIIFTKPSMGTASNNDMADVRTSEVRAPQTQLSPITSTSCYDVR